jgi:hypothetical protein
MIVKEPAESTSNSGVRLVVRQCFDADESASLAMHRNQPARLSDFVKANVLPEIEQREVKKIVDLTECHKLVMVL